MAPCGGPCLQVRFFFGVFDDLTEFDVLGFSKEAYENVGGNLVACSPSYSPMAPF